MEQRGLVLAHVLHKNKRETTREKLKILLGREGRLRSPFPPPPRRCKIRNKTKLKSGNDDGYWMI